MENNPINSEIEMRDGHFGIWLNLQPFLPTGSNAVEVFVMREGIKISHGILLPHQLYLDNVLEWTENRVYPIYFIPVFPPQTPIPIFKKDTN